MGGGCQSPVGAHAEIRNGQLRMQAVSFMNNRVQRAETKHTLPKPDEFGRQLARKLKRSPDCPPF
jgi:porphobilinogen deaminase